MRRIKRNAIRCKVCGDVIESEHVHDFKFCKCGAVFIDGGQEYQRIGGDSGNWENLVEYEDVPGYFVTRWRWGKYTFATTEPLKKIIAIYEDQWNYIRVEDENHNVVYETHGLDTWLDKMGYY